MKNRPKPGDKVRLTKKFLQNTGQVFGSTAKSRWIVVECDCDLCRFEDSQHIAVNEKSVYDECKYRHFAFANLEQIGGRK